MNNLLKYAFDPILKKNKVFKDKHAGETCYIFGNGASINFMNLGQFNDYPAIGLNLLCLHNDMRLLNLLYYVAIEPFGFYPFFKNPYIKKYQKNIIGRLFKQAFFQYSDIPLFTSISNIIIGGLTKSYYVHHFNHTNPDVNKVNLDGIFSFMSGAFSAGIGLAIYLGFKKAILIGCDYTFSPSNVEHFYGNGPLTKVERKENVYGDLFKAVENVIELSVITDGGVSPWIKSQNYEDFTGEKMYYKKNTDIVKPEYLDMIENAILHEQYHGRSREIASKNTHKDP